MSREPVASFAGGYRVYFDPPSCQRSYGKYSIYRNDKYVGGTYSLPDLDACRYEEMKRNGTQPQSSTKIVPAHRYQPPTGKYAISIQMHRTAEKNRAAKRAAKNFAVQVSSVTKPE